MKLTVEWGTEYEVTSERTEFEAWPSEAEARAYVAQSPTDTGLRMRYISEWQVVD